MGGLFGGGGSSAPTTPVAPVVTPTSPTSPAVIGPYPDDGAQRMPVANSPSTLNAARKKRDAITSRSGRESTRLVQDTPGTRSYGNSFLGSVG